jgi:hypothetical protein
LVAAGSASMASIPDFVYGVPNIGDHNSAEGNDSPQQMVEQILGRP